MAENLIIAQSVEEAASMMKGTDVAFLAGGTEVNKKDSSVKAKTLVSIGRLALDVIDLMDDPRDGREDAFISVGATATFQEIIESELIPSYLKEACLFLSSRTRRNMATIGGNIALLRDDSYVLPTLLAAKAKLIVMSPDGEEEMICSKAYVAEHEKFSKHLILKVLLHNINRHVASKRIANTASSHAVVTIAVGSTAGADFKYGYAIKGSGVFERNQKDLSMDLKDDIWGSAEYKKYLLDVIPDSLLKEACDEN